MYQPTSFLVWESVPSEEPANSTSYQSSTDLSHARTRRYCIGLYCWHHMPLQAVRAQVSQCLSCGNLIQQRTQQGLHESISVEIRSWPLADTLALLLKARGTSVQQQCLHCNMTVHAQAVRARTRRTRSSLTVAQLRQSDPAPTKYGQILQH